MNSLIPITQGQPIQIHLTRIFGSNMLSGQHTFEVLQDGYRFQATISIWKMTMDANSLYSVRTWLTSAQSNDSSTAHLETLGSATVRNMDDLNAISFNANQVGSGDVTLLPKVFVGSKSADFRYLK